MSGLGQNGLDFQDFADVNPHLWAYPKLSENTIDAFQANAICCGLYILIYTPFFSIVDL
jgi:hypothetical protein